MKKFFTIIALCVVALTAKAQFAEGMYMLTEGWYGSYSGDVYFFDYQTGAFTDGATFKQINGSQLGETGVNATVYGDNAYLISKQDGSFGGGILSVVDASTMKLKKTFTLSDLSTDGHNYDGRSFCGVSEEIGYLGTSNGIFVIDLVNMTVVGFIEGTDCGYGVGETIDGGWYAYDVYMHQVGSMVRVGDYVFASQQNRGILVINALTHTLETTIVASEVDYSFGTFSDLVVAKDGSLWTAPGLYNNWSWDDTPALPYLVRIDPYTLQSTVIDISSDIDPVKVSWSTYRAPMLQTLKSKNRLVWRMSDDADYSAGASRICYYDIDENTFGVLADISQQVDGEGTQLVSMYSSLSVDPENDYVWTVGSTSTYGGNHALLGYNGVGSGEGLNAPITQFSGYEDYMSTLVFTDDYAPEFSLKNQYEITQNGSLELNLLDIVSDKDNMDACIVVTVEDVANPDVATASVLEGKLKIEIGTGETTITVKANSNGKVVSKTFTVVDDFTVGIESVNAATEGVVEYYNLQGVKVENPEKGVYIKKQGRKTTKVVF